MEMASDSNTFTRKKEYPFIDLSMITDRDRLMRRSLSVIILRSMKGYSFLRVKVLLSDAISILHSPHPFLEEVNALSVIMPVLVRESD